MPKTLGEIAGMTYQEALTAGPRTVEDYRSAWQAAANAVVERCIHTIKMQKRFFAAEEYATGQPTSSIGERFACDQCIEALRSLKCQASPGETGEAVSAPQEPLQTGVGAEAIMTVADLQAKLSEYPPTSKVLIEGYISGTEKGNAGYELIDVDGWMNEQNGVTVILWGRFVPISSQTQSQLEEARSADSDSQRCKPSPDTEGANNA